MSGFIGGGGAPTQFQNQIFVGSATGLPFQNVNNTFATLPAALAYIATLTGASVPSFTNKFVIWLVDAQIYGQEQFVPDWVWALSYGQDIAALAEPVGSSGGDYIISVGVGGIADLGVTAGLVSSNNFPQTVQIRDSASLYSPLQEPFAVVGGETLNFFVNSITPVNITLQVGDTTATLVAARINAGAGGNLVAIDSYGRVRVRGIVGGIADVLLQLLGTGTGNTLFGWLAAGTQTIDPSTTLEFRVLRNVEINMFGAGQAGKYAINVDDVSFNKTSIQDLRVGGIGLGAGCDGIRFGGGLLNVKGFDFRSTGVGLDLYDDGFSPTFQQEIVVDSCGFSDNAGLTQIRFNDDNIKMTVAASSYNPQKVRSGVTVQPANITGITIDLFSENSPAGSDGELVYTQATTSITWEAPGETIPGLSVNIGVGGSFTLTADGGSIIDITVVAGSLPGVDQTDSNIVVKQVIVDALTQAGSIEFADKNAFFGPSWSGQNAEDAIAQLGTEIREVYIAGGDASIGGVTPGSAALPGNIGGFPSMVYVSIGDSLALWPGKFPNVAAIGDRPVSLILHTVTEATPTVGTDVKFDIETKYVDDGDNVAGASSESLTTTFAIGAVNIRTDIAISLNNALLAGDQQLRFEIERDVSVANNANVKVHITGVTIRG